MRPRYRDLFAALVDPDPARADAAFDAILFDRGEALDDLAELYATNAREPRLRFYAIQLMGFSEDARAVPTVIAALGDHDPSVRAEACRAVEDLRARDAIPALEERLDDLDPEVRASAREALASFGRG